MKKLHISLIFSNLAVKITTTKITAMHNLFANFVKILEVCKFFAQDFVNDKGNMPRPGVVPKFSDRHFHWHRPIQRHSTILVCFQKNQMPSAQSRSRQRQHAMRPSQKCFQPDSESSNHWES